jgi:hypothetical protein
VHALVADGVFEPSGNFVSLPPIPEQLPGERLTRRNFLSFRFDHAIGQRIAGRPEGRVFDVVLLKSQAQAMLGVQPSHLHRRRGDLQPDAIAWQNGDDHGARKGFATSRTHSMNNVTAGLMVRSFTVIMTTGGGCKGNLMAKTFRALGLRPNRRNDPGNMPK